MAELMELNLGYGTAVDIGPVVIAVLSILCGGAAAARGKMRPSEFQDLKPLATRGPAGATYCIKKIELIVLMTETPASL